MTTFAQPGTPATQLAELIKDTIHTASASAPRSRQKRVGLSEIGEVCVRKSSYKIMGWPKIERLQDPWPSISGTAIHAWLADTFTKSAGEYLVEHRVSAAPGLSGSLDLFDITNKMVIDHKCVGATSMKSRKSDGMTHQQRVQINLYGLGIENELGVGSVKSVALAFYPLGGRIDGLYTIVEEYNRQLALDAITRFEETQQLVWKLDPKGTPENWNLIPATSSYLCSYCPWFLPGSTDLSKGCPGEVDAL